MSELDRQKLEKVNFVSKLKYKGDEPGIAEIIDYRYKKIEDFRALAARGVRIDSSATALGFDLDNLMLEIQNNLERRYNRTSAATAKSDESRNNYIGGANTGINTTRRSR